MRRGLTMLELLFSLALLTVVMLTAGSWIRLVSATGALAAGPARWEASARAALQLIEDDILVADFHVPGRDAPVEVADGGLILQTRLACAGDPSGPLRHRYSLDPGLDALRLEERTTSKAVHTRRLLTDVRSWSCEHDEDRNVLSITLVSNDGVTVSKRYRLP